jgi:excisionase family DNA binding protein
MLTTDDVEPFCTAAEVALLLGKPLSFVYQRQAELHIPRYKIGQSWRYRRSEIIEWLKKHAA